MIPAIIILNVALIVLIVGALVAMHLYAIKSAPSEAQMMRLARQRQPARQARARVRATSHPVFDR